MTDAATHRRPIWRRPGRDGPRRAPDPAPSRWRYRLHRLWLTPAFRNAVRVGLPLGAMALGLFAYLAQPGRLEEIGDGVGELVRSVQERPEFMVTMLRIEGAGPELQADILEALPVDLPLSQFALDLDGLRAGLEELDPVARAEVRVRPGGTLLLAVSERIPALAWVRDDGIELLDAQGHRVAALDGVEQAGALPLVAGEAADAHVPEALRLMLRAGALEDRLVGLSRIGGRRWDVLLTGGQRVMLPERDPLAALDRALEMDAAADLLSREVLALDLRIAERPTLRLTEGARDELRRVRQERVLALTSEGEER
jgi:cell division protein FtsQ